MLKEYENKMKPMPRPKRETRLANSENKKLWVVGQWIEGKQWELQGVFDSEDAARAACANPLHFIGPVMLNQRLPTEGVLWPNAYYPSAEVK